MRGKVLAFSPSPNLEERLHDAGTVSFGVTKE